MGTQTFAPPRAAAWALAASVALILTVILTLPSLADTVPSLDTAPSLATTPTCPQDIYTWLDTPGTWPLDPVVVGSESYGRAELAILLDDEDLEEDDASVALASEIVAAKLNRAAGVAWDPLDDLLDEADAALAPGGLLPQGILSDTESAAQPLQLAESLADFNGADVIAGCPVASPTETGYPTCPIRVSDWATRGVWPLQTVQIGSSVWSRASVEALLTDVDPGLRDPRGVLRAEIAAARLNQASGIFWKGLSFALADAESTLAEAEALRSVDTCSSLGIELTAQAARLEAFNGSRTLSSCLPARAQLADLDAVLERARTPRRCEGVWGFAELHTHMFAEFGWNEQFIEGSIDDPATAGADPASTALARCSGLWDHASLRFPYIVGMGITAEELVAVRNHDDSGKSSPGDTGLHLGRRNGFDTRSCNFACVGPGTCIFKTNQAACEGADPGFCKDDIPGNISVAAALSCNTQFNRGACESAGYCGAKGSSLWSITDDLDPCWAQWPNCDAGDTCLKRDPLKLLECNDLNESECNNHSAECDWSEQCKLQSGSLTCGDLNQTDCNQYGSWCNWDPGSCFKDPLVLAPFECNDLTASDCNTYSECSYNTECRHVSGSLTCGDLSRSECSAYNECSWFWGRCRNNVVNGSLTCGDLSQAHCGNHSECAWQGKCEQDSGSLTCGDLTPSDCSQYGAWCNWDAAECYKDPLVLAPFECNDLDANDCATYSECGWEEKCKHPIGAPSLECSDLTLAECANHWDDGGCGVRDCEPVSCEWNDWGECRWDNVWPPHCGEHFRDWPAWDTPTHQQHWWGHLQDSWRKGLRIISASILEVDPLGTLMPGGTDRTPYEVVIDQLEAANHFAANHSWVEIATSAAHARQIAEQGNLAMVLTLEANFPFCKQRPCGSGSDEEDIANILTTLDEFHALGVRGYQVMSHFDNPFAGVAVYTQAIHLMQWLYEELNTDGNVTSLEMAAAMNTPLEDAFAEAADIANGWDPLAVVPVLGDLFPVTSYDDITDIHALMALVGEISGVECMRRDNGQPERCATCLKDSIPCQNIRGLTPLGEELVKGLIDRGILVDIAHLSELGVQGVWDVVQSYAPGGTYPLYLSHGDPRDALPLDGHKGPHQEKTTPPWILDIITQSGGMFGMRTGPDEYLDESNSLVDNDCVGSSKSFAQAVTHLVDAGVDVGFALDMNGMIANAVPRFIDDSTRKTRRRGEKSACLGDRGEQGIQTSPLVDDPTTPHTDESRYNSQGLGHIGLLGAHLDDLDAVGLGQSYLDHLYGSAEAFIQMWESVP